jgi:hypothetical protein
MSSNSSIPAQKTHTGKNPVNIDKKSDQSLTPTQRIARYCVSAYQNTERVGVENTNSDRAILSWLKSTNVALKKLLPQYLTRGLLQEPYHLSGPNMGTRYLIIELILWSCFSASCYRSILESLTKLGKSDADLETIQKSIGYYTICVKTMVGGFCSNIHSSRHILNDEGKGIAAMPFITLQATYLENALQKCNEFVLNDGALVQTISPFVEHIRLSQPQRSVSSIWEYCDIVKFWNKTLSSRGGHKIPVQNAPALKQPEPNVDEDKKLVSPGIKSELDKNLDYIKPILNAIMDVPELKALSGDIDTYNRSKCVGKIEALEDSSTMAAAAIGIENNNNAQVAGLVKFFDQLRKLENVGQSYGVKTLVNILYPLIMNHQEEEADARELMKRLLLHIEKVFRKSENFWLAVVQGTAEIKPFHIPCDEVWKKADQDSDGTPLELIKAKKAKGGVKKGKPKKSSSKKALTKKSKPKPKSKAEKALGTPVKKTKTKNTVKQLTPTTSNRTTPRQAALTPKKYT